MRYLLCILLGLVSLSSCYRMPCDDDYCVIPTTNNPDVTREKVNNNSAPSMKY